MISHVMLEKPALVSFSKSSNSAHSSDCFDGFEKLTCACFFAISLEIMRLPTVILQGPL